MAIIHQHPSAPVKLDPPLPDGRHQAVLPSEPEDNCSVCGVATKYHWAISGMWVGCQDALKMQQPPRNPQRWNDLYPSVTVAVRLALITRCGPAMGDLLSTLTHDEVLAIASELGRAAVTEYARSLGK